MAALKELKTASQLASHFKLHPTQIHQWKRVAQEGLPELFERGVSTRRSDEAQERENELYQEIEKLKMELEWLKKNLPASTRERCRMTYADHRQLSVRRQCELLGVSRSTYYHRPAGETSENLELMRLIDEQHLRYPFSGRRQMTAWLRLQGYKVNEKRIRRLISLIGLEAVFPGAKDDHRQSRTSRISLPASRNGHLASQPCLERRHHVHPNE